MHRIEELKDMAIEELERYAERGEINRNDLPTMDCLAHFAKNLCKILEYCEDRTGYSYGTRFNVRGTYSNADGRMGDRSYRGNYSYRDDYSNARRRDSMGRYSGDDNWMIDTLHDLREKAPNEQMRMEFQEFIDRMERMK